MKKYNIQSSKEDKDNFWRFRRNFLISVRGLEYSANFLAYVLKASVGIGIYFYFCVCSFHLH